MTKPQTSKVAADPDFGPQLAAQLNAELALMPLPGRILRIASLGRAVFTTSLGLEDQVLTSIIAATRAELRVVTLDTGRLFAETLELLDRTEAQYGIAIEVFRPWKDEVDGFVALYGMNGFYDSVEARHACCHARKLQPLGRALADADIWVTGLRRGQSGNRANAPLAEWDADRSLLKINPLADQSLQTLQARARRRCAGQSAACEGFSLDRLRALHPRHQAGRARARRALVVGTGRAPRMRAAPVGLGFRLACARPTQSNGFGIPRAGFLRPREGHRHERD